MAKLNFDATAIEPAQPREGGPLPAGTYSVEITNAEVRDLKSGKGQGLSVEYTVIDPEQFARRKVWSNFNIVHENPRAQDIGQEQLSALCAAFDIAHLGDSDELFQRILSITTRVKESDGYGPRAEVVAWHKHGHRSSAPAKPAPAASPAPAAPANKPAPAWRKAA